MLPIAFAQIGIPTAGQCLSVLAPIGAVYALFWLYENADAIIHRLFPHLAWERQLGWLNLRSQLREEAFLRSLGYFLYVLLALALLGIVWGAEGVNRFAAWVGEPLDLNVPFRLIVLAGCLFFWTYYLAAGLAPRLRREYEEEDLQRFRAEVAELEREREEQPTVRSSPTAQAPLLGAKIELSNRRRA